MEVYVLLLLLLSVAGIVPAAAAVIEGDQVL